MMDFDTLPKGMKIPEPEPIDIEGTSRVAQSKNYNMHQWDEILPLDKIMNIANRILRKNGKMVLFANRPFTTELINSQIPNLPHNYNMNWVS